MLLLAYGTRPEWIKIKPIIDNIDGKIDYKVIRIKQHKDIGIGICDYNIDIDSGNNRLNDITSSIISSNILGKINPSYVMVQGDTTSAFAMALSAFHAEIPIIHLEAGLRTYDMTSPFPEEFNRSAISLMASIHLCPSEKDRENLLRNNIVGDLYVTGNTVLDGLIDIKTSAGNNVIITMHRRENLDIIPEYFKVFSELAQKYESLNFILPIHPNPLIRSHAHLLEGVSVIEPLNRKDMLNLIANCKLVITDSGGVQEESCFFNKRTIVCRSVTERDQGYGMHICKTPEILETIFNYATKK